MTLPTATITPAKILVGYADLYVGIGTVPYGTYASPLADTSMEYMGATEGGVMLENKTSFDIFESFVDQQMAPVKKTPIKHNEEISLTTSLSEATLKNIARAWGYADAAVSPDTKFYFGNSADEAPNYRQIIMVGKAPSGLARKVLFFKGVIEQTGAQPNKRDADAVIPVKITAFPDDAAPAGSRQGFMEDATSW